MTSATDSEVPRHADAPDEDRLESSAATEDVDGGFSSPVLIGATLVIGFFVAVYGYNLWAHSKDTVIGDQWTWVRLVLIPHEDGRLSYFDAVTSEFSVFSHSHIPTLAVLLFNSEFLDLNLNLDRIIGFLSLCGVLWIVFRHARTFLTRDGALMVTAFASSLLFLSSSPWNFAWSLIQFQLFYVLVALLYLRSFAARWSDRPWLHAALAVPATVLFGDAIGVAAIVASLLFLGILAVRRAAPLKSIVAYYGLFPVQIFLLSVVFTGERTHGNVQTMGGFLRDNLEKPGDALQGLYYAFSTVFVALRPQNDESLLLAWGWAPLWFVLAIVIGGIAFVLVIRTPLHPHEHFSIMLIMTGMIWIVGVLRARLWITGPEGLQASHYPAYTTLIGLGLALLLASKTETVRGVRRPLAVLAAFVVLINGAGSLKILQSDRAQADQRQQLVDIYAFVDDEIQGLPGHWTYCADGSCLRSAQFLEEHGLAAFRGQGPNRDYTVELRSLVHQPLDDAGAKESEALCRTVVRSDDDRLLEWAYGESPLRLDAAMETSGFEVSPANAMDADRVVLRTLRSHCRQSSASDGDRATLILLGDREVTEGNSGEISVDLPVSLSEPTSEPVTVGWETVLQDVDELATSGVDYLAGAGTVVFAPGETSKTVTLTVLGDAIAEPSEDVLVVFLEPSENATVDPNSWSLARITIRDDD